ncbi:glutaredoxin family protein [Kribbia dieselivorans]|uniref:glutaredoxin family protein n=1 Tax=Kribbia dieselivorans TaxID=331526 RepID=UPI000837E618|nr:glutaredoxin family protein [Kribbia dieselivorans]
MTAPSPQSAAWVPAARISVVSRDGCHLCDDVETIVARVAADVGVTWERVDVDAHPELRAAYSDLVPVTLVDGRYLEHWRITERKLRKAVRRRR